MENLFLNSKTQTSLPRPSRGYSRVSLKRDQPRQKILLHIRRVEQEQKVLCSRLNECENDRKNLQRSVTLQEDRIATLLSDINLKSGKSEQIEVQLDSTREAVKKLIEER